MSLVLKATAITLLGLAFARLAHNSRASIRHAILVATFAALALLPLATLALPNVVVAVPLASVARANALAFKRTSAPESQASRPAGQSGQQVQLGDSDSSSMVPAGASTLPATADALAFWWELLLYAWLAGSVSCLIPLVAGVWRVRRLRRTALPADEMQPTFTALAQDAGPRRRVELLMHEQVMAPITCGLAQAAIIVPPDAGGWSAAALQRALVHELEHVRRRDWAMQLFSRGVCAAYWFNPLVWIAYRQLCLQAEHACDDAVVAREEGSFYAEQLVTLARRMSPRPAVAALGMAHRSDLSARISAMLDGSRPRGRAGFGATAAIVLGVGTGMMVLAPLQLSATDSGPAMSSNDDDQQQPPRRTRTGWLDRALVEAADEGDLEGVRDLLDRGADVNAAVDGDGSALIIAAREGHFNLVRLLIDRGANPNLGVGGDGASIIMAAREGHVDIVRFLLDRGADVDLTIDGDENALIQASGEGRLAVVELLVSRGANVNARVWADRAYERPNGEWRTPLNMAQRGGHRAVVALLRAAGAVE
jgi:beta-lactamase regulating signal transducer with metallopeptidase domain